MASHAQPIGPFPTGVDEDEYDRRRRRLMWKMPSGLYLLGSSHDDRRNLMTCNLVSQVAMAPKLVSAAVEKDSFSKELVLASKSFSLCLLRRQERAVVRSFVKPATDDREHMTLNGHSYFDTDATKSPVLSNALGYLDLTLAHFLDLGSHTLCIGEVVDARFLGDEAEDVLRMEDTRMNYGG